MDTQDSTYVIRDWPIAFWIMGAALLFEGLTFFLPLAEGTTALVLRGILTLAGLAVFLFSPIVTVTADRSSQTLTITSRSPVREKQQELLFSEIDTIDLQSTHSSRGGSSYRIVVYHKDGREIPFHSYYSSGYYGKINKINGLRSIMGMEPLDRSFGGSFRRITQRSQVTLQKKQEALTGSQSEVHETSGVHWQVQTVAFGAAPVTRWFSPDYRLSGDFVYIVQLPQGQKALGGGLLGGLTEMLYQQSLSVYGFGADDTPGLQAADLITPPDGEMEESFAVYTSSPGTAQSILNQWAISALTGWARRYPLKTINSSNKPFQQLVVMYSPQGVYVASMGTMIPEAVEEMTRLGVDLVKSQIGMMAP